MNPNSTFKLLLWIENYPTETQYRMEAAKKMFDLGQYGEAIPVFQQVRSDPKYRVEAGTYLGRSFLMADFVDEAIDTLKRTVPVWKKEHFEDGEVWVGLQGG